MSFFAGVLTFVVVINCLLLILLILMQLPKKDAGAGVAFGGAAADALFGAGSGNFLTQTTRYATIVFFALALLLSYVENQVYTGRSASEFEKTVQQKQTQTSIPARAPLESPSPQPAALPTNNLTLTPVTPYTATPATPPATAPGAPGNTPAKPTQSK